MIKRTIIFLVCLTLTYSAVGQAREVRIDWDYAGTAFPEFVVQTEARNPVRFYFKEEWIKDLAMPDMGKEPLLSELLGRLFSGRGLWYMFDNSNIIITKDYRVKTFASEIITSDSWLTPREDHDEDERPVASEYVIYEIGNPSEKGRTGSTSITGYVRDRSTGEALNGVTVFIAELAQGTATDANGFYVVNLPRGSYNIRFSFLGMKEANITARVYGGGRLDIDMAEDYIPIEGAVITARKNDALRRLETGVEMVNMATFRLMPSSLGETDIFKNILILPGIKTVGEASQGFNVRGGASDQNLILLYGVPLFNPSHFFGFFTSVNSDVIRDLQLYKGGMPARYGGRLSSVMDIIPRDAGNREFTGKAGISPIAAHITLDIPLIKEKMSALVAARSTYSNWVMNIVDYPLLNRSRASFQDLNARIVWKPDGKNSLELSGYQSLDAFRLNSDTTYSYSNTIASLRWNRSLDGSKKLSVTAATSNYRYNVSSISVMEKAFDLNYNISFTNLKADLNWAAGSIHELNAGAEMGFYSVLPGNVQPADRQSLVRPETIGQEMALENALWIEDRMNLSERFSLSLGLRYSLFLALGPGSVRLYEPGLPRSGATINDTLTFGPGTVLKTWSGPEPRVSFNYMISDASPLKLNYTRTRQYLHLLTNSVSIAPTDTWKMSDYYLSPQVANQYSAGFYRTIPWNNLELSAEIYFKPIRNMIDFKAGTVLTMNESIEKDIVNVEGRAYGIELMFRKSYGKITWHCSYTYSRIMLRTLSEFESESVNSGKWFPASYDKPHDLSASLNYTISRRLNFALSYVYNTGRPITYPTGYYESGGLPVIHYSDRNKYRIPDYSRMDGSLRLKGNLKSKKLMNPSWTFSCYNLLSRPNVYSEYFIINGKTVNAYRLSVFARAIPTVTYSFDF